MLVCFSQQQHFAGEASVLVRAAQLERMRHVRLVSRHKAHRDVQRHVVAGHRHQIAELARELHLVQVAELGQTAVCALQLADLTRLQVSDVSRRLAAYCQTRPHYSAAALQLAVVVVVVTHLVSSGRRSPPRHLSDSVLLGL